MLIALVFLLAAFGTALAREPLNWVTYVNDRFGFSLRYPADVFAPERRSEAGDGEVFVATKVVDASLWGPSRTATGTAWRAIWT